MSKIPPKSPAASAQVPSKDTIYIDPDDEITSIIDKLKSSPSKIVALVLPKHPAALQSSVNLKLLKRSAESSKKNIVLITSDHTILSMAGVAGLFVAKTPQSKPEIPTAPKAADAPITVDSDTELNPEADVQIDTAKSIGELAGEETIEVDNAPLAADVAKAKGVKKGFNKKLKIPNFDSFRKRLFLGIGILVLLIVGWIFANLILPRATITLTTDTSTVNARVDLSAKDGADTNVDKKVVPLLKKQVKKTNSESTEATGQRDEGKKATGTLTLTNCIDDGEAKTIPAGTGFSSGDLVFVTDDDLTLGPAFYSGGECKSADETIASAFGTSKSVGATAARGGEQYNLGARSYSSPAGFSTSSGSLLASGSEMSGGTSKIVKIVSQSDIDSAKQKALDKISEEAPAELRAEFATDNAIVLDETFKSGDVKLNASPKVNEPGDKVSVAVTVTFTQLGVRKDDLKQIIEAAITKQIDTTKQVIQDNGLGDASISIVSNQGDKDLKLQVSTTAVAGPSLDENAIKAAVAGKKKGETRDLILARPGIRDAEVKYSPFWVFKTPKSIGKITIIFKQTNADGP